MDVARSYPELGAMLGAERGLDLLVISTPDDHHPVAIGAAAAAGVAVFCEKPLANSAAVAESLAATAAAAGIEATVGYSFRYSAAVQRLRDDLRSGALGEPWLLELHEHNAQFHPVVGRTLTWKGDPDHAGGGALFEYGAHVIDLGCWLLGPVDAVSAQFANVVPGAVLDDTATLQLRFRSGALGTLITSWVLGGGFPGIRVRLHGSAGGADALLGVVEDGSEQYRRWLPRGEVVEDLDLTPRPPQKSTYACRQLADLLDVLDGRPSKHPGTLPTLEQAAVVQRVLDTALQATDTRRTVPSAGATSEEAERV
jgi:predicted dehydrogenase